jgi:hypothetical protein
MLLQSRRLRPPRQEWPKRKVLTSFRRSNKTPLEFKYYKATGSSYRTLGTSHRDVPQRPVQLWCNPSDENKTK